MQKNILFLHGWGGSDYPHWQSVTAGEVAKNYGCVSFLRFSDVDFPKLDIWKYELKEHIKDFKPNIVVCHSLANTLWFHLCQEGLDVYLDKLYLVAPPRVDCDIKELKEFFPIDIPKNLYAKEIKLVVSTNDPYLNIEEAKEIQKKIGCEIVILENAGHINADSGYGKWEWIENELLNRY